MRDRYDKYIALSVNNLYLFCLFVLLAENSKCCYDFKSLKLSIQDQQLPLNPRNALPTFASPPWNYHLEVFKSQFNPSVTPTSSRKSSKYLIGSSIVPQRPPPLPRNYCINPSKQHFGVSVRSVSIYFLI